MNLRGLDLNLLVILDALLSEQNVTHAGNRIHLSQSATSNALARLRSFFGDELLIPVSRKMILTPLGQSLVVPVREILMQIQGTIASKAEFDPATSTRTFRIMGSDFEMISLIPELLRYFEAHAPNISLDIRQMSDQRLEFLEKGEVDLLIVPSFWASDEHPTEKFYEDYYICCVWNENRLVGERISMEQYLSMAHVVVKIGHDLVPILVGRFLKQNGYSRRIAVEAPLFSMVPNLLVGTTKIATLFGRYANFYAKQLPIRLIPLPFDIPNFLAVLQWHKYQDHDPGLKWLRETLRNLSSRF